jgi:hypothetical protein
MNSSFSDNVYKMLFSKKFQQFNMSIIDITFPGCDLDSFEIGYGSIKVKRPATRLSFSQLAMTIELDNLLYNYEIIEDWMMYCANPRDVSAQEYFETGTLQIYTPNTNIEGENILRREIQFTDLFPVSLSDIKISSNDSEYKVFVNIVFDFSERHFIRLKDKKYFTDIR